MKKCIKGITLAAISFFCVGCTREISEHRVIPDSFIDYLPKAESSSPLLDDKSLYEIKFFNFNEKIDIIRFWDNGHVMWRFPFPLEVNNKDVPSPYGDNFYFGRIGIYRVCENEIYIEFFETVADNWRFVTYKGKILSRDSINIYEKVIHLPFLFWTIDRHESVNFRIVRRMAGQMNRQPDW